MIKQIDLSSIQKVREFIQLSLHYDEDIVVSKGKYIVDGHSILGVLSLGDLTRVTVEFIGDEQNALEFFNTLEKIKN
jgi:phosphotransferase system HPr-like phosphotransfer protein